MSALVGRVRATQDLFLATYQAHGRRTWTLRKGEVAEVWKVANGSPDGFLLKVGEDRAYYTRSPLEIANESRSHFEKVTRE